MQRKLPPDPSQFALLECLPVQIIKIILRKRKIGGYYFCDTSKFGFSRAVGGILFILY